MNSATHTARRFTLIVLGAVVMAFNLNTFVHAGSLIPGGFTGLTLLIQEIADRYGGFTVPFTPIYLVLNAVPALISFRFVGRWYTLYSCLMIVISAVLTDVMPTLFSDFLQLHDPLLSAVFGGLLSALSTSLCLKAGATAGGTDFIAIFISERYKRDSWNYIFIGNCVILTFAGFLFTINEALYSIIFQFTTTLVLKKLYRGYQQKTLLIITNKADEVYRVIRDKTNHDATSFTGIGCYQMQERILLYSVVSSSEVRTVVPAIRKIDPGAFINVLRTDQLNGRFYQAPRD